MLFKIIMVCDKVKTESIDITYGKIYVLSDNVVGLKNLYQDEKRLLKKLIIKYLSDSSYGNCTVQLLDIKNDHVYNFDISSFLTKRKRFKYSAII